MLRRITLLGVVVSAILGGQASADADRPPGSAMPPMMFFKVEPAAASPGAQVTITGLQFMTGARVWLGGSEAGDVTVETGQRITVTVPEHTPGKVSVMVRNPDGRTVSRALSFKYEGS